MGIRVGGRESIALTPFGSIRAVVFDAVGTLIYPSPSVAEAYAQAGVRHGFAITAAEVRERFHKALPGLYPVEHRTDEAIERQRWQQLVARVFRTDVERSESLFRDLWKHFAEPDHWSLFDDVVETWDGLRQQGYRLALASNFDQRLLQITERLSPLQEAEAVFCSSLVGYCKPHRAFFRHIERALELEPKQLLLVGDDPQRDYAAARSAGWFTLLVDRESPATNRPDTIRCLRELLED